MRKFDILGYERQLRGWLQEVENSEKEASAEQGKNLFVLCTVNEEAQYLFVLQKEGLEGFLRLAAALWRVDKTRRQVYPVPPHVEKSKLKLQTWLAKNHYDLREI